MISFIIAIIVLILGYILYGSFVERVFGADSKRATPVTTMADGVDYVEIPSWKIFLIQFLNIAGLGPVFGAIMGILYGPSAFLWIVFGTIFAGAVHDYLSGMISLRMNGASLPEIDGGMLGSGMKKFLRVFITILMMLVGAVFVFNTASLLANLTGMGDMLWIIAILIYFMLATLLPIDKIIGGIYPLFGFALLFMALGVMVMMFAHSSEMPEIWQNFGNHKPNPEANPIFPMMFVSIACGAISGFHATQSPLMARCLKTEKHGRIIFYGAMVSEGIVALIWAAAAVTFYHGYDGLQEFLTTHKDANALVVNEVSTGWLGFYGGILAVLGVVAAPITSGDTALRSARLIVAESLGIEQKSIGKRLLVSIPIFGITFLIMLMPYEAMWRYFAWTNQVLAAITLWALSVWMRRNGKPYIITMLPAMFMTAVYSTYIFFAPEGLGLLTDAIFGMRIGYDLSVVLGVAITMGITILFLTKKSNTVNLATKP